MEIVVEKALPNEGRGGTCNCGSNNSGGQGSMCRGGERASDGTPLAPPLDEA